MKFIYTILVFLFAASLMQAQDGTSINKGAAADDAAELEVVSTSKGLLIPRVTSAALAGMSGVEGLMVYNTSDNTFNYYDGTAWIAIPAGTQTSLQDADGDTKITAEKNSNENILRFTSGMTTNTETEVAQINNTGVLVFGSENSAYKINNAHAFSQPNAAAVLKVGDGAGNSYVSGTGTGHVLVGNSAGSSISSNVNGNTIIGSSAGASLDAQENTLIGYNSALNTTTGASNTIVGTSSLAANTAGANNTIVGYNSAVNSAGDNNIVIGANSLNTITTGQGNIAIGESANFTTVTASDSLNIGNIITADLATGEVAFNNAYSFTGTDGNANEILQLSASNKLEWSSRVPKETAAAAADFQAFDQVMGKGSTPLAVSGISYSKIISFADAELTTIQTHVEVGGTGANIYMGVYNEAGLRLAWASTTFGADNGDLTLVLDVPVNVISSNIYYVALYTENNTACKFLNLTDSYNPPLKQVYTNLDLPVNIGTTTSSTASYWVSVN